MSNLQFMEDTYTFEHSKKVGWDTANKGMTRKWRYPLQILGGSI